MSTVAAMAITLLALAGCGSSGTTSTTPTASTSTPTNTAATPTTTTKSASSTAPSSSASGLSLEANGEGQLAYTTKSLSAKAGKVSIAFTNNASLAHNVTIESSSGQVLGGTPSFSGGSKTVTLNLKPGTYKFFCSVPGHRQAGMEGTLVVK
jgi:plastocyanin